MKTNHKLTTWTKLGCALAMAVIGLQSTPRAYATAASDVEADFKSQLVALGVTDYTKATASQTKNAVLNAIAGFPGTSAFAGDFSDANSYATAMVNRVATLKSANVADVVTGAMVGIGSNSSLTKGSDKSSASFAALITATPSALSETVRLGLGSPVATALPRSLAAAVGGGVSQTLGLDSNRATLATTISGLVGVTNFATIADEIATPSLTGSGKALIAKNVALKVPALSAADATDGVAAIAKIVAAESGADRALTAYSVASAANAAIYAGDIAYQVAGLAGTDKAAIAYSVTRAQSTKAVDINTKVLSLVTGSANSDDQVRIAISGTVVSFSTVIAADVVKISGTAAAAVSGSNVVALTQKIFTSAPSAVVSVNTNNAAIAAAIASAQPAKGSDIVTTAIGYLNTITLNTPSNRSATATAVAVAVKNQGVFSPISLVAQAAAGLESSGSSKGGLAKAVAGGSGLLAYAPAIARDVAALSGTGAAGDQAIIANLVASTVGVSGSAGLAGEIAYQVGTNFNGNAANIGAVAAAVAKAQVTLAPSINARVLDLVSGATYDADQSRITIAKTITGLSTISADNINKISGATAALISGSNAKDLAAGIITGLASALGTATNDTNIAIAIAKVQPASASEIAKAAADSLGLSGTTSLKTVTNQKAIAASVAAVALSKGESSQVSLVAKLVSQLVTSGSDKGNIAKAVAGGSLIVTSTSIVEGLPVVTTGTYKTLAYAPQIARDAAQSGAGGAILSVQDQGIIANLVASTTGVSTTAGLAGEIAYQVGTNMSSAGDIGAIAASVAKAQVLLAPDVNTRVLNLATEDGDRITISSSITALSTLTAANVVRISGTTAATLTSGSNAAGLASRIIGSLTQALGSVANDTSIAVAIAKAQSGNSAEVARAAADSLGMSGTNSLKTVANRAAVAKGVALADLTVAPAQISLVAQYVAQLVSSGTDKGIIAKTVAGGAGLLTYAPAIARDAALSGTGGQILSAQDQGIIANLVASTTGVSTTAGLAGEIAYQVGTNMAGNAANIGTVAAAVAKAQLPLAPSVNARALDLVVGTDTTADNSRITISRTITGLSTITAASILSISGTTATLVDASKAGDLAAGIITSLTQALGTITNDANIAVAIANVRPANSAEIAKAAADNLGLSGSTSLKTVTNQSTIAKSVALAAASKNQGSQVSLVAKYVAQLVNSAVDKGAIGKAVAGGAGLLSYAGDIARDVALSGVSSLPAMDQAVIANAVASTTGVSTTAGIAADIAAKVGGNMGGDAGSIGLVANYVTRAQFALAPAINSGVLALITGTTQTDDLNRITISGSIANVSTITIASVKTIAGFTTTQVSGNNAAQIATTIIGSVPIALATSLNKNDIAVAIALNLSDASYGASVAGAAANTISDAAAVNGKGVIAANIAGLAAFTGYAPAIANQVALTTGSLGYQVAIANKVATNSAVVTAGNGLDVVQTVENTSLGQLNGGAAYSDYLDKAKGYANVAANYAAGTGFSKQAASFAADSAVSTITNTATGSSNGSTGINYYKVAQIFGDTLAAANSASAIYNKPSYVNGVVSGSVSGMGTLAYTSGTTVANAIGNKLGTLIANAGGAVSRNTPAFNLTEVFAAVGVAITHNLATTDTANISAVVAALATIEPKSAPDLLGTVLTDLNIRAGATPLAFSSVASPAYVIYNAVITSLGVNATEIGYVNDMMIRLFNTVTPSAGKAFLASAKTIYHTYDTVAGYTAGKLVGDETPILNF